MITSHVESFIDLLPELKPIFPIHYLELALNQDKVPLDVDYDKSTRMENNGTLFFMSLRESGKLVGYFIGMIDSGLHYKSCLTCQMDIFYVHPDHRGSGAGFKLFRDVETELKRRKVQRLFVGSKMHKDASWLFNRLGYEPVETYYSTWLGE
jgi:GNAT superfamily N-acetyltransferase